MHTPDHKRHLLSAVGLCLSATMLSATSPGRSALVYQCGATAFLADNFILVPETPSLFFSVDVAIDDSEEATDDSTDRSSVVRSVFATLFLSGRYMTVQPDSGAFNEGVELTLSRWQRVADDLCAEDTDGDVPADTGNASTDVDDGPNDTGTTTDTGTKADTGTMADTGTTHTEPSPDTEASPDAADASAMDTASDTGMDAMPISGDGFEFWWVDGECFGWHELKSMPLESLSEDDSEAFQFEYSSDENLPGSEMEPDDVFRLQLRGNGHAAVDFMVSSEIIESEEFSTGAGFGCIGTQKAPDRSTTRDAELCAMLRAESWSWTEVGDPSAPND